nr:hypothetical protein [Rickettsia massiliae]
MLLVFFIVFMDPVVKPRGDTVDFIGPHKQAFCGNDINPYNNL